MVDGNIETNGKAIPNAAAGMSIKITKDGPYHATGHIPLDEKIITPVGHHNELREGRALPQAADYFLCRCGGTHTAPFCDGTHERNGFKGTEVADRKPFAERIADTVTGTTMTLLDDDRCAYARFCHREPGDVWQLTEADADPHNREEAIIGVSECIAGRLVEIDNDGKPLEAEAKPEISVIQDPAEMVSGPLYAHGPIPLIGADGFEYEVRNRIALCRCGASADKPFCDATHVRTNYRDSLHKDEYGQPRERATGFTAHS